LGEESCFWRLSPNRSLERLSVILGCLHRYLSIFRLFVGILQALFTWPSLLRLHV